MKQRERIRFDLTTKKIKERNKSVIQGLSQKKYAIHF